MLKDDFAPGQEVDIDLMNVIVSIPVDTVRLDIVAHMLDDNNEIMEVKLGCSLSDIHDYRDDYVRNLGSKFNIDKDFADGENLMNIILQIPQDAVWLDLKVRLADMPSGSDDNRMMRASDIHKARELFLERIPDGDEYNFRYVLTEKGRRILDEILGGDYFKETEDD